MTTLDNRTGAYATSRPATGTEQSLQLKDMLGIALATIMTLGPLAATALFSH